MRTYTLAFSIVVHLLAVAIGIVTPIVANGVLPEPRRAFDFITVRPVDPPPPAPRTPGTNRSPASNPGAAPTTAPDSIRKETGIETEPLPVEGEHGKVGGVIGGGDLHLLGSEPEPPPPAPAPRPIVRVGGSILPPQKLKHVAPDYPALARAAHREGIVILEAVIGEDGKVRSVRVLRSIDLLDQAAVDAVRQWQFTPTRLNGEPVPVVMTVTVSFVLQP